MKKFLLILFSTVFVFTSQAQIEGCDGARYVDDVFSEIKSTKGIKFGEAVTLFGNFQELFMDVYEPENDDLTMRPTVILAFGGSFIGGERADLEFLCEAYARKGYVAVTIDYRLYDGPLFPIPTETQMKNVVIRTVSDMKAAIRYMRQDAATDNLFQINPNLIFVGGVSAGAITAFHTATIDEEDDLPQDIQDILAENGGIDGNSSDNIEYSSEVQGVVNMSGGLNDASWIDTNDPPFVSIHDDMDQVVPYGGGFASIFNIPIVYMEGSQICKEVADSVDVRNQLRTIENSEGHVSYFANNESVLESINFTANFLAEIICGELPTSTENIAEQFEEAVLFPNPTNGQLTISGISNQNFSIEMIDMLGRKVGQFSNRNTLDLTPFENGMYHLKIRALDSEDYSIFKIVVEK